VRFLYLLGIDAGTTAIKCILFNESGEESAISRRNTTLLYSSADHVEQDMSEIWIAAKEVIREVLVRTGVAPEKIAAIGITGQAGGTLLVDTVGHPVKMISWRDLRTSELVLKWKSEGRETSFYKITGWPLWPQYATVHLAWLKKYEPELLRMSHTVFSCVDWIAFRLTGERRAAASSLNGIINTRTGDYSDELLRICDIEELGDLFPEITNSWEKVGEVGYQQAREVGLRAGTPVVSAGYDVACCAAGAHGISKGNAISIIGTSGTNVVVSERPVMDEKTSLICAYHTVPHRWLAISEAMSATPNLNWFINEFCGDEEPKANKCGTSVYAYCDKLVEKIAPGADGLIYHPYLTGETGPFMNLNARASFFGISNMHSKLHLLRAVYEGVGYSTRHNFSFLESCLTGTGIVVDKVVLVGGGSRSDVWCQMISDILRKTVLTTSSSELGCVGAAMSAAVAVGILRNYAEAADAFVHFKYSYEPNSQNAYRYGKLYAMYERLCSAYNDYWNSLAVAKI
jgi:L-xylulokinase